MKLNELQKIFFRQKINDHAKSLGFDLIGFSPAKIDKKYLKIFEEWLATGCAADMEYMKKIEQRKDMGKILPGAKSVIVLGMNYYHEQEELGPGHGRIACYAYGRDYHKIIGKKLKQLERFIWQIADELDTGSKSARAAGKTKFCPGHQDFAPAKHLIPTPRLTKSYVDTGPLMERALTEQAGLGRIGKNGCLITKEFGSWVFLAEIITTLDLSFLPSGEPARASIARIQAERKLTIDTTITFPIQPFSDQSNQSATSTPPSTSPDRWSNPAATAFNICGNCRKCVTACPTGAIIAPGIVDSRLCISYLTIENKKKIPPKLAKIISKTKRLFGCDICQEVCPHNQARQKINDHKELSNPKIAGNSLDPDSTPVEKDFIKTFAGSPLMRSKIIRRHRITY